METREETWHGEHSIESAADPERIWALFVNVGGWNQWNAGVERMTLEGPFETGTAFTMKIPGQEEALRSRLVDVREGESFVDETRVGPLLITVAHRIERLETGFSQITYALDARGPEATQIGPAIAADFPEVLRSLAALAAAAHR